MAITGIKNPDDYIPLPQVKGVHIDFDVTVIKSGLKSKKVKIDKLDWPEAIKAMYKNCEKAENELLHIKSCCDKALNENIIPFKNELWNRILIHNPKI